MIVTSETPFHEGTTVAESGPMLPHADVITDHWYGERGIKVRADADVVYLDTDTLSLYRQQNGLTPDEAYHLARLLIEAADKANGYLGRS
jgi:hypothetical protein